ncbi:DUF3289 family protein [Erwinia aphidicola]|uniref:DUF3289 family protein n=1 Tax=Erwinia aphidicola TaxID=68334 RepID=UPI0017468CD9|nr:DUF3289 family protein [Erwinia aphidicola]MBD1374392.1 DUF3289 family protein [Erwinia aphidicola]
MSALTFPCTLFKTQKQMDDNHAEDMRCGDLSESQLKTLYHLVDVSSRVNPWTLTKVSAFTQPQSMFQGSRPEGEKVTRQQCAAILFDEFRQLSRPFALYGPYSHLIEKMITHMQVSQGKAFSSMYLDVALKEHIQRDTTENSTRKLLKDAFDAYIDWENRYYPVGKRGELRTAILGGKLPKFDRLKDNFNGMGISVHDTWATHITLKSLKIGNDIYRAVLHYKVQDHFGLDSHDMLNAKYSQFRLFRIWFVLQRFNKFAFKPFMTNMEATVVITGGRSDNKK